MLLFSLNIEGVEIENGFYGFDIKSRKSKTPSEEEIVKDFRKCSEEATEKGVEYIASNSFYGKS